MRCGLRQISSQNYKQWLEISGIVKVDGKPKRKRILVVDRLTGEVDVIYSDAEGKFIWRADESVYEQNEARFLVLTLDDNKIFNAEVADFITPAIVNVNVREIL